MSSPKPTMEEVFQELETAKELESTGDPWGAAKSFGTAQRMLRVLSHPPNEQPQDDPEAQQIAKLCQQKSYEYLHRARSCLIQALQQEDQHEQDKQQQDPEHYSGLESISDNDAEQRIQIFASLFAKDGIAFNQTSSKTVHEQEVSLEDRLQELNASLPHGFKTSDERMKDINRGLNRLGLESVVTAATSNTHLDEELPKSEDEQLDDILAQVHDELALAKQQQPNNTQPNNTLDMDDVSTSSDENESEQEDDLQSWQEMQRQAKHVQRFIGRAQAKLVELQAIIDAKQETTDTNAEQEPTEQQQEQQDLKELEQDDDSASSSSSSTTQDEEPPFDLGLGKRALLKANKYIQKAFHEWPVDPKATPTTT